MCYNRHDKPRILETGDTRHSQGEALWAADKANTSQIMPRQAWA
jgi:hypothetical protein